MNGLPPDRSGRGAVLALVLVVVAILSVVAASELLIMRSELGAASAARQGHQARAAAYSGIERVIALLAGEPNNYEARYDDPDIFQGQQITAEGEEPWYFTVFAGTPDDQTHVRNGVEDEAGKINLNTASQEMLLTLPGMTAELVDCLLDYRDADSDTRPQGAEQDHYDKLPVPYAIRNGPLGTVEELLLVKGFTGSIVYGEDANRNGLLDANEDDGDETFPPDNRDGTLDRGLYGLVTVASYEPNVSRAGTRRININAGNPQSLSPQLADAGFRETAIFIAAGRSTGLRFNDPADLLGAEVEIDNPRRPGTKIRLASGVNAGNLALVMDKLTTGGVRRQGQETLVGRVNINSAPKAVLAALPGLNEDLAQRIVDSRGSLDEGTKATTAWLFTQNVVDADGFKKVSPWITARTCQFRIRSVGYSMSGGRFCVLEAVVDLASGRPRITYLRDLTRLGVPFALTGVERG